MKWPILFYKTIDLDPRADKGRKFSGTPGELHQCLKEFFRSSDEKRDDPEIYEISLLTGTLTLLEMAESNTDWDENVECIALQRFVHGQPPIVIVKTLQLTL